MTNSFIFVMAVQKNVCIYIFRWICLSYTELPQYCTLFVILESYEVFFFIGIRFTSLIYDELPQHSFEVLVDSHQGFIVASYSNDQQLYICDGRFQQFSGGDAFLTLNYHSIVLVCSSAMVDAVYWWVHSFIVISLSNNSTAFDLSHQSPMKCFSLQVLD